MKVRTLCTSTLLAALAVSTLGAQTTFAAPAVPAKADVTVENGDLKPDPGDKTPDPEKPGEEIDPVNPPTPNPDPGQFGIIDVAPLDFGTIKTSAKEVTKDALPQALNAPAGQTRGAYVNFGDIRSDAAGYRVTAKMTKQFTIAGGTDTLKNSTITYSNTTVNNTIVDSTIPGPTVSSQTFELTEDAASAVNVATATSTQGKGKYTLEFGRSKDYTGTDGAPGTDGTSVKLKVPVATASSMKAGNYTAEITWTMEAAE